MNPPFPLNVLGGIFFICFQVIVNILVALTNALTYLHIPGALGLAIILISVLIRLIVWPFMSTQLKTSRKMAELQPHLSKLKEKHGSDKQALALAQNALYKEHGINPAAGCLPALLQIPIVYSLYQSIQTMFSVRSNPVASLAKINDTLIFPQLHLKALPDTHFLGFNLASQPSQFAQLGFLLLLVPVLTAALQFVQSTMMTPSKPVKEYPSDSPKEKKEKEGAEETMAAVQSQMKFMMPLMIGFFSYQYPVGLSLYWNTFTILGIVQQYLLSGWGGARDIFKIKDQILKFRK